MFFALFDCLYIIESLKKIREIAGFIPNPLRFHKKKLKAQKFDQKFVKTRTGKNRGFPKHCALQYIH